MNSLINNWDSNWEILMNRFDYGFGDSIYFTLFIICAVFGFALVKSEDKFAKIMVVAYPILITAAVFCPIVFGIVKPFADNGGVYWRFFWIIPIAPVVAFSFVKLVQNRDGIIWKVLLTVGLIGILKMSGSFVYNEENFQKVDNYYKAPDDMINILQALEADENDLPKKVMCPIEVTPFVRQYNGTILLEYNRNAMEWYPKWIDEFSRNQLKISIQRIMNDNCNYLICRNDHDFDIDITEYGYEYLAHNDTYTLFKLK